METGDNKIITDNLEITISPVAELSTRGRNIYQNLEFSSTWDCGATESQFFKNFYGYPVNGITHRWNRSIRHKWSVLLSTIFSNDYSIRHKSAWRVWLWDLFWLNAMDTLFRLVQQLYPMLQSWNIGSFRYHLFTCRDAEDWDLSLCEFVSLELVLVLSYEFNVLSGLYDWSDLH